MILLYLRCSIIYYTYYIDYLMYLFNIYKSIIISWDILKNNVNTFFKNTTILINLRMKI